MREYQQTLEALSAVDARTAEREAEHARLKAIEAAALAWAAAKGRPQIERIGAERDLEAALRG